MRVLDAHARFTDCSIANDSNGESQISSCLDEEGFPDLAQITWLAGHATSALPNLDR